MWEKKIRGNKIDKNVYINEYILDVLKKKQLNKEIWRNVTIWKHVEVTAWFMISSVVKTTGIIRNDMAPFTFDIYVTQDISISKSK
jgi:cAMP phosphodiesterase